MAPINLGKLVEKALTRRWSSDMYKNSFCAFLDNKEDAMLEFTFNYETNYALRIKARKELGFWHYDERSGRGRKELYALAQHLLERFPEQCRQSIISDSTLIFKALTADDINERL